MEKWNKVFKWGVIALASLGAVFFIILPLKEIFLRICCAGVVGLAIYYFVQFEKTSVEKIKSRPALARFKKISRLLIPAAQKIKSRVLGLNFKKITPSVFLTCLAIIVLISLEKTFSEWQAIPVIGFISKIIIGLKSINTPLIILVIISGFFTFFLNKEKIRAIEEEKTDESLVEQKRKDEFPRKYPKTNKIPLLRNFIEWFQKDWKYAVGLIAIIFLFTSLSLYINFSNQTLGDDEYPSYYSAINLFELPSGNSYTRGMLLQFMQHLLSKVTTNIHYFRIINILFFIILVYAIKSNIKSRSLKILFLISLSLNPLLLAWSAEIRHYFIFSILTFILLTKDKNYLVQFIILLCLIFSGELALLVVPLYLLIILSEKILKNEKWRAGILTLGVAIFSLFSKYIYHILTIILPEKYLITLSPQTNAYYINSIFSNFLVLSVFFILAALLYFKINNKIFKRNILFVFLILVVITNYLNWKELKYIIFLIPSFAFLFSYLISLLLKYFSPIKRRCLLIIVSIFWASMFFSAAFNNQTKYGMAHHNYDLTMLKTRIQNSTIIITTNQFMTYEFIQSNKLTIKEVYWLRRNEAILKNYLVDGRDFWVGYEYLDEIKMSFLEKWEHIIIIGDQRLFSKSYVDLRTQEIIKENFYLIYENGDGIKVYEKNK